MDGRRKSGPVSRSGCWETTSLRDEPSPFSLASFFTRHYSLMAEQKREEEDKHSTLVGKREEGYLVEPGPKMAEVDKQLTLFLMKEEADNLLRVPNLLFEMAEDVDR